jgi:hypothetical protein
MVKVNLLILRAPPPQREQPVVPMARPTNKTATGHSTTHSQASYSPTTPGGKLPRGLRPIDFAPWEGGVPPADSVQHLLGYASPTPQSYKIIKIVTILTKMVTVVNLND